MEAYERMEVLEDVRLSVGCALDTLKAANEGGWLNETIHILDMAREDVAEKERRERAAMAEADAMDRAALEDEYWKDAL